MNCSDWEQEIAGESESAALEEHLRGCGHCREFAEELERNRAALQAVEIHPAAFDAVRLRVLSEIRAKKQTGAWWAWPAVAAAACVAVLCASIALQNWKNPAPPRPVVAAKDPLGLLSSMAPVVIGALNLRGADLSDAHLSDPLVMLPSIAPVQSVVKAHHRLRHQFGPVTASARPAHNPEPLVVKMLTNDPNVIIIWLVDQKGDSL